MSGVPTGRLEAMRPSASREARAPSPAGGLTPGGPPRSPGWPPPRGAHASAPRQGLFIRARGEVETLANLRHRRPVPASLWSLGGDRAPSLRSFAQVPGPTRHVMKSACDTKSV